MERLTRLVDGEMEAATLEHNEAAELEELAFHLQFEMNKVIKRQVELNMARTARENDEPDKMTCCDECGGMMPTPARGDEYICDRCQEAEDDPTYPEDDHVFSTFPPAR